MFQVGDKVVYPMHGAGVIEQIEEKEIFGKTQSYYIMHLPIGALNVMIPTDPEHDIGLRAIVSPQEAAGVLERLSALEIEENSNWNKRYRDNMLRLKSGELQEVARVVKSLLLRDSARSLSTSERKMLVSAKQILVSELALALDRTADAVEQQIDALLHE